jgi:hypothetical protein
LTDKTKEVYDITSLLPTSLQPIEAEEKDLSKMPKLPQKPLQIGLHNSRLEGQNKVEPGNKGQFNISKTDRKEEVFIPPHQKATTVNEAKHKSTGPNGCTKSISVMLSEITHVNTYVVNKQYDLDGWLSHPFEVVLLNNKECNKCIIYFSRVALLFCERDKDEIIPGTLIENCKADTKIEIAYKNIFDVQINSNGETTDAGVLYLKKDKTESEDVGRTGTQLKSINRRSRAPKLLERMDAHFTIAIQKQALELMFLYYSDKNAHKERKQTNRDSTHITNQRDYVESEGFKEAAKIDKKNHLADNVINTAANLLGKILPGNGKRKTEEEVKPR